MGKDLSLNTPDVYGFAAALRTESADFVTAAAQAVEQFSGGGKDGTTRDSRPYAADPRNEPAQPIVDFHNEAMEMGVQQLKDMATGISRLSIITSRIAYEFNSQDKLNGVDIETLRSTTGIGDPDFTSNSGRPAGQAA